MPPSQLKRLKSTLREQGITGPQKSKKIKNASAKDANARIQKHAALQGIRDSFNPFELKAASRPPKFQSVSYKSAASGGGGRYGEVLHRPGVTRSLGEEARRATLLPELQRRHKVGGLIDRRIGEGDTTITPEEKALQRFAREKQRKNGGSLFDLEGSDEGGRGGLTHLGRPLGLEDGQDDFQEAVADGEDSGSDGELMRRKRQRSLLGDDEDSRGAEEQLDGQPERKKTKAEVMTEVIAKSKLHKYERQKTKEDDDDLREQLDSGMQEMLALLQGHKAPLKPSAGLVKEPLAANGNVPRINPDRQTLLDCMDRVKVDKQYEQRLRQLAQDARAAPAERTKTAEEKAAAEAARLEKMEVSRQRRMRGEPVSEDEDDLEARKPAQDDEEAVQDEELPDDAAEFGFASSNAHGPVENEKLVLDDEDEFVMDEDLIANSSDIEESDVSSEGGNNSVIKDSVQREDDEEDEFVRGILGPGAATGANSAQEATAKATTLSYTYPCPRSHTDLLEVLKNIPAAEDVATVVQRIRAFNHPSLSASNKEAMADFSCALVDHIAAMANSRQPLPVIETLIRHVHSLSRTYPEVIANALRMHLHALHVRQIPTSGDLAILTAIGSIYPTSDHFHPVVTPAITLMARWLGMNPPRDEKALATGAFLVALCVSYQRLSRRYIPEAVRFTLKALSSPLAAAAAMRTPHVDNTLAMADLWKDKSAFTEIFTPLLAPLQRLKDAKAIHRLHILLHQSRLSRRALALHHHKPLPIRTSIPKFEESFNPDRHYDPDRERSDARKLQSEYRRERKGALRELRKDASFVAREQLRAKRERDAEYERRQRRLVAEIQGEDGRESKEYERVKRARKSGKRQ